MSGSSGSTVSNWSRTVAVRPACLATPATLEELQAAVKEADSCAVVGSYHSFSRCCDTLGTLVSLERLDFIDAPDGAAKTVRCGGGATYTQLAAALRGTGLAMHNTPALPQVTAAGAASTGTHGSSGVDASTGRAKLGSMSSAVVGLELVLADSTLLSLRKGEDARFDGAVVSMGCLGVIYAMTLQLVPAFEVCRGLVSRNNDARATAAVRSACTHAATDCADACTCRCGSAATGSCRSRRATRGRPAH